MESLIKAKRYGARACFVQIPKPSSADIRSSCCNVFRCNGVCCVGAQSCSIPPVRARRTCAPRSPRSLWRPTLTCQSASSCGATRCSASQHCARCNIGRVATLCALHRSAVASRSITPIQKVRHAKRTLKMNCAGYAGADNVLRVRITELRVRITVPRARIIAPSEH